MSRLAVPKVGDQARVVRDAPDENPFEPMRGGIDALERQIRQAEKSYVDQMTRMAAALEGALADLKDAKAREDAAQRRLQALRDLLKE